MFYKKIRVALPWECIYKSSKCKFIKLTHKKIFFYNNLKILHFKKKHNVFYI